MKTKFKIILALTLIIGLVLWAGWYIYESGAFRLNLTVPVVGVVSPPCVDNPASSVELGNPSVGGLTAEFTTNGSDMYITARKFDHSGILSPDRWMASVYVGLIDKLPSWDSQRYVITNVSQKISYSEGNWGNLKLDPGRYWLWAGGSDNIIISCDPNGVSDPKPVSGPEKLKNVNEN